MRTPQISVPKLQGSFRPALPVLDTVHATLLESIATFVGLGDYLRLGRLAQLVRALARQARGQKFESSIAHFF